MTRSRRGKRKYGPVARAFQGTLAVVFVLAGVFFVITGVMVALDSKVLAGVIVVVFGLAYLLWATRLIFRASTGKRAPTGASAVFFGGGGDCGGDGGGDGGGSC